MGENSKISAERPVGGSARSVLQFHQADFQLDGCDQLRDAGPVSLDAGVPCGPQVNLEAGFVGIDRHFQAFGPWADENVRTRTDDLFQVRRESIGQAISQKIKRSKLIVLSRASSGPVRLSMWNSQLPHESRVGGQVELVMHLVADGNGRPADKFDILDGAGVVSTERPFTVLIERERHAPHAAASGASLDALQAYGLQFLDGLSGSVHSALLGIANAMALFRFQQAGPA